jgi:hypothetical protein
MAIGVQNFRPLTVDETNPTVSGLNRGFDTFSKGVNAAYLPKFLEQKSTADRIANALAEIDLKYKPRNAESEANYNETKAPFAKQQIELLKNQNQWYEPNIKSEILSRNSQSRRNDILSNLPFGGQIYPGAAGRVMGLEIIRQQFGEDSPQYKMALKEFETNQNSTNSRTNYQDILTSTLKDRTLTSHGKTLVEESRLKQGASPTGEPWPEIHVTDSLKNNNLSPDTAENLTNESALIRQKQSSDVDTRQKNLYATNIEKTIKNINPDDLTRYSGLFGGIKKMGEEKAASVGKESKQYDDYQKALQAADFLTTQIRKFYGESIQPEMRKMLNKLSNPEMWERDPKLAKSLYDTTTRILKQELDTYRDALKNKQTYQSEYLNQNSKNIKSPVMKYDLEKGWIE